MPGRGQRPQVKTSFRRVARMAIEAVSFEKRRELCPERRARASGSCDGQCEHNERARFETTAQHSFTARSDRLTVFEA